MRKIKELSNDEVKFIGVGGPEMLQEGLQGNYYDVNQFLDKPLIPYKNFLHAHVNQSFHPIMATVHSHNKKAIEGLTKKNFWNEIFEAKPKASLTIGNHFFMKRFNIKLKNDYHFKDTLTPPLIHYGNLIINQRQEFEDFCDYWLYTVPKEPVNWFYYKFPSTYVGSFGAGRAIEYLYRASEKTKHLVDENSIMISKKYNTEIMDTLLEEERLRFRENNGLSNEATVFYGLPGNTEEEIKWAVPLIRNTVKVFLDKFSQYSSENFAVVITSAEPYQSFTHDLINQQNWPCKVIIASTEHEKYSALAGSDMGAVVNGDAVAECAAYHLPTVILNNTSFFQSYFTLLYNSFNNDLNIALNGEAYPECLGQAFPEKIVEYWGEWFEKPSKKYDLVARFENIVTQLLPQAEGEAVEEKLETKALAVSTIPFNKYYNPEYLAAKKVLEAVRAYDSALASQPQRFEIEKSRKTMLSAFV